MTVGDIVEMSAASPSSTRTRRCTSCSRATSSKKCAAAAAAAVLEQATPLDETEVAETPVPLPLVAVLALLARRSRSPRRSGIRSTRCARSAGAAPSSVDRDAQGDLASSASRRSARPSRSLQRRQRPPARRGCRTWRRSTSRASLLHDPWGHAYKYLPQPQRYLVIGFTPDEKPDTDLFLSHVIDVGAPSAAASKPVTGGIQLLD